MTIELAARGDLTEIEVRKYTPKTIRSYRNNLNLFLRFCGEEVKVSAIEDLSMTVVKRFTSYKLARGRKCSYANGLIRNCQISEAPAKVSPAQWWRGALDICFEQTRGD